MSEGSAIVQAEGLRKTYKPDVRALDGLSFSVPAGTVFALLGPNGAGKTTTVRILTTLARPDSGSARVAGIDVLAHPSRARSVIGAVSQHSGAVSLLTGQENLALQGKLHGMRGRALHRRVAGLLDQFGLAGAAGARRARTPAGCADGWTSPPSWSTAPPSCSSMSRPPALTLRAAPICGRC